MLAFQELTKLYLKMRDVYLRTPDAQLHFIRDNVIIAADKLGLMRPIRQATTDWHFKGYRHQTFFA